MRRLTHGMCGACTRVLLCSACIFEVHLQSVTIALAERHYLWMGVSMVSRVRQ